VPNPNIAQGTLNRLIGSLIWVDAPELNVTASFLMPEGMDINFEGSATDPLNSMTGIVMSPAPYQVARVAVHLLKSQSLSDVYKTRLETTTMVGNFTIQTDSRKLGKYQFVNGALTGVNNISIAGRDAGFVVGIVAEYHINSGLWD
jgi:hypothetical protein